MRSVMRLGSGKGTTKLHESERQSKQSRGHALAATEGESSDVSLLASLSPSFEPASDPAWSGLGSGESITASSSEERMSTGTFSSKSITGVPVSHVSDPPPPISGAEPLAASGSEARLEMASEPPIATALLCATSSARPVPPAMPIEREHECYCVSTRLPYPLAPAQRAAA
jgi:hypothetical protein